MKFSRELPVPTAIRQVSAEGIRIGADLYGTTLALTVESVTEAWTVKSVAALDASDFEALLADEPELVLLGTGASTTFPPRELTFNFARRGIGLEVMDTAAAARTFNVLAGEGRRVVAVLFQAAD